MTWLMGSLILVALAGLIWLRLSKKDGRKKNVTPVYACPECGEHHCNCYLEDKVE